MVGQQRNKRLNHIWRVWILVVLAMPVFVHCGKTTGRSARGLSNGVYTVRSGDSLWEIAKKYKVPVQELAEWNNILDPDHLVPGTEIHVRRSKIVADGDRNKSDEKFRKQVDFFREKFIWPVDGIVFSTFGIRHGRRHDGIDISIPSGTPIKASAAGEVVFNKKLRGYGNIIILRHPDHYYTAYAHNSKNLAKLNQKVSQGDVIAEVGRTGRASGPHVHFEIRRGQEARNPLFYLAPQNERQEKLLKEAAEGNSKSVTMGGSKKKSKKSKKATKKSKSSGKSGGGIVKYKKTTTHSKPHKVVR